MRGRLVLIDFWTFCCINCLHILPHIAKLERKFGHKLAVIGVHSGKFQSERSTQNIKEAVQRYRITHPVINDHRMQVWQSYTVRAWPTLMFIDPLGNLLFRHQGEFAPQKLENIVERLIEVYEKNSLLTDQPLPFILKKNQDTKTLFYPGKIECFNNDVIISDSGHNRLIVADQEGKVKQVIGSGERGLLDGNFDRARFNNPQGIVAVENLMFIADEGSHTIRKVDMTSKRVTTVAGTGEQALYSHTGGDTPTKYPLNSPYDLAVSTLTNSIYIAMAGFHQIWRIDAVNGNIEPWAGSGYEGIKDGTRMEAMLAQPMGVSFARHNLFFTDSESSSVRIAKEGKDGRVITLVGEGLFSFGDRDGISKSAKLQHPEGITIVGARDMLYVVDTYNNKLRSISLTTLSVSTVKCLDEHGNIIEQPFYEPSGVTFGNGLIWVADTNNHSVKFIKPESRVLKTLNL